MSLHYISEHTSCLNYLSEEQCIFHVYNLEKDKQCIRRYHDSSFIVILLSGGIAIRYGINRSLSLEKNRLFLLPKNLPVDYMATKENTTLLLCTFSTELTLCSRYSIQQLENHIPVDAGNKLYSLPADSRIVSFATMLVEALQSGLGCVHYHCLKRDELLLYLRAGYTKEQLALFFYPVLGRDIDFKDFMLNHFMEVSDVKQLAVLSNMSLSTFNRRFKETFHETAKNWLLARKSEHLLRDIVMGNLSFAELAIKYNFSSTAYLATFCKKNFGSTPYELRNRKK